MNIPIQEAKLTKQNFDKLHSNRIVAFANQDNINDPIILSDSKFKRIIKLESAIVEKAYFVIFNKKFYNENKELVESFWNKLKKIRDTKTPIFMKNYLSTENNLE